MIVSRDSICHMINDKTRGSGPAEEGFGFLLVQLGFHAAERFAEALAPLGLEARHVGMLRRLAASARPSRAPSSFASCSSRSAERATSTTTAPRREHCRAICSPNPLDAPVIRITLS